MSTGHVGAEAREDSRQPAGCQHWLPLGRQSDHLLSVWSRCPFLVRRRHAKPPLPSDLPLARATTEAGLIPGGGCVPLFASCGAGSPRVPSSQGGQSVGLLTRLSHEQRGARILAQGAVAARPGAVGRPPRGEPRQSSRLPVAEEIYPRRAAGCKAGLTHPPSAGLMSVPGGTISRSPAHQDNASESRSPGVSTN
jgi:hypothetical protein